MISPRNPAAAQVSQAAALDILGFFANQSQNVQYVPENARLIIKGLGHREAKLVSASLLALGAQKANVELGDSDDGMVILSSAEPVAQKLAAHGVQFVGRAGFAASPGRG